MNKLIAAIVVCSAFAFSAEAQAQVVAVRAPGVAISVGHPVYARSYGVVNYGPTIAYRPVVPAPIVRPLPVVVPRPVYVPRPASRFVTPYGGREVRVFGQPVRNTVRTILP